MSKEFKSFRPKFYQAVFKLRTYTDIMKLTKGLSIKERMGSENGECPECQSNHWWLLPKECVAVREGGKPYIECLNCGYQTHL